MNRCYWCGGDNQGKHYHKFCNRCFEEWEFLRDLGAEVMENTLQGKDTLCSEVLAKKERNEDFNRRWHNTQKLIHLLTNENSEESKEVMKDEKRN